MSQFNFCGAEAPRRLPPALPPALPAPPGRFHKRTWTFVALLAASGLVALIVFLATRDRPGGDKANGGKSQCAGSGVVGPDGPATAKSKPISSIDMWFDYGGIYRPDRSADANASDPDRLYTGKVLTISVRVREVERHQGKPLFIGGKVFLSDPMMGREYRRLSERERRWLNEGYPPNIICFLASDATAGAEKLKEDDEILIRGKVIGKKKAEALQGFVVELIDCRVIKE